MHRDRGQRRVDIRRGRLDSGEQADEIAQENIKEQAANDREVNGGVVAEHALRHFV